MNAKNINGELYIRLNNYKRIGITGSLIFFL